MKPSLGQEVRRLRLKAGITLRGLAAELQVSAAHLSDIEHDRRRPSEVLLRKIAHQLRDAGATFGSLEQIATGIDPETREWVASTPGVRRLLRKVRESGDPPHEIIRILERSIGRKGEKSARSNSGADRPGKRNPMKGTP